MLIGFRHFFRRHTDPNFVIPPSGLSRGLPMNTKFACLEQRMVNTYLDTFPNFVSSESGPGFNAQEQFYQFMRGLYQRLSLDPALMFSVLHEDDAYTHRFNKGADNKPKLRT
jgi:hypothetical protein